MEKPATEPKLKIENLNVSYLSRGSRVDAVKEFSLAFGENESVGLLGESGAGKSTVGWALLGMIGDRNEVTGEIVFRGRNVLKMTKGELKAYRWRDASMIFQASLNTLDPLITVGQNFVELLTNKGIARSKQEAREMALRNLQIVALRETTMQAFPHQLSGGMKQRVAIAMAISTSPALLIADEPTTALDTITQASILGLLRKLREEGRIRNILFISHDVTVHAYMTQRLIVMFRGRTVEEGATKEIITNPMHPYTRLLLSSERVKGRKEDVKSDAPEEAPPTDACPYVPFCPHAMSVCSESFPKVTEMADNHRVSCYLYGGK